MDFFSKKWFTFVELIVVVTILGILGTVGIISYNTYLWSARDSNRLTQLSDIKSWLGVYSVDKTLPTPEDSVNVLANTNIIGYQWYAGEKILNLIGYNDGWRDPLDKTYFTYYITKNKKDFQLMAFLEEEDVVAFSPVTQTYAASVDYAVRYPTVTGKNLGALVEKNTNTPIQEVPSVLASGDLDIALTGSEFDAYYDDNTVVSGTWGVLVSIVPNASCKRILELGNSNGSAVYKISPTGVGSIQVYCDMETDGWGWTRMAYVANGDTLWNAYTTDNTLTGSTSNTTFGMKMNQFSIDTNGEDLEYIVKVDGVQVWDVYSDVHKDVWEPDYAITSNTRLDTTIYTRVVDASTPTACTTSGVYHSWASDNWSITSGGGSGCSGYAAGWWFRLYGSSDAATSLYGLNTYDNDTSWGYVEIWVR